MGAIRPARFHRQPPSQHRPPVCLWSAQHHAPATERRKFARLFFPHEIATHGIISALPAPPPRLRAAQPCGTSPAQPPPNCALVVVAPSRRSTRPSIATASSSEAPLPAVQPQSKSPHTLSRGDAGQTVWLWTKWRTPFNSQSCWERYTTWDVGGGTSANPRRNQWQARLRSL